MRQNVKLLLHAYQRKKKTFALGWKKKEQCCLFWKKKENVADSPFAPKKSLFVCFQKQNGKPCQKIPRPKTVSHDFFWHKENYLCIYEVFIFFKLQIVKKIMKFNIKLNFCNKDCLNGELEANIRGCFMACFPSVNQIELG